MAGEKFLKVVSGVITEEVATQTGGAGNENLIPSLDNSGKLDTTMMPTGMGPDTASLPTSDNFSAGDLVNVYDATGTATARKADASVAGKEANGFVLGATTIPGPATVYFAGQNSGVTSLTPGKVYFLDTTAGKVSDTPPSGSAQVVQRVGRAIDAAILAFQPGDPITLAT